MRKLLIWILTIVIGKSKFNKKYGGCELKNKNSNFEKQQNKKNLHEYKLACMSSAEEMRKYIDTYKRFQEKSYIMKTVSELTNESITDANKVLMVYEIDKQRTYLIKTDKYFILVNDNRGDIRIVLKRLIDLFMYSITMRLNYYELQFDNTKLPIKVSRKLFSSVGELRNKLDNL